MFRTNDSAKGASTQDKCDGRLYYETVILHKCTHNRTLLGVRPSRVFRPALLQFQYASWERRVHHFF
jgi:hypothetical protein